jgi:endonuclease/exonuclease/phosphatase family metal-dependent hydrolase
MPELVVATWNLQGRDPRRIDLAGAVAAWSPDVLLLQEADGDRVGGALPDGYPTRLWWPTAGTRPGLVIAARQLVEEQGILDPVDPPWDRPRVAWARLRSPVGPLTVASVHLLAPLLPGRSARRNAQRAELAAWAEAWVAGDAHLVVAGDFNTRDPALPRMTDACAASRLATWRPLAGPWMGPILRLDAVFVSRGLRVLEAGIGDSWRGSDHLPVIARIDAERERIARSASRGAQ